MNEDIYMMETASVLHVSISCANLGDGASSFRVEYFKFFFILDCFCPRQSHPFPRFGSLILSFSFYFSYIFPSGFESIEDEL